MPTVTDRSVAFSTPWFDVLAKHVDGDPSPHYTVQPPDYVTVVAVDPDGRLLLVKQYRPVIESFTIELPSGLVDPGETPEACARRELLEETGCEAEGFEPLGALVPDVGRLGNRMHSFAAAGVRPVPGARIEAGLELVRWTPAELAAGLTDLTIAHALNHAVILLAMLRGRLSLPAAGRR
ncbi:MAG: NUDIX hydrolase [Acidobacteria bacterium]|nr:NUDIX hydrolase [Acidobacteriota bacterium]